MANQASLARSGTGDPDAQMTDVTNGLHESSSEKSPRFGNLGFLKGFTERKTTRDGQPQKRRGPKPDSKPAMTRRQELNRQAQRTHRERKEIYIRTIEEELVGTKMNYNSAIQINRALREENEELKRILMAHGIYHPSLNPEASIVHGTYGSQENSVGQFNGRDSREQSIGHLSSTYAAGSLASTSGTQVDNAGLSPVPMSPPGSSASLPIVQRQRTQSEISRSPQTVHHQMHMDHAQLGVDFVLALEAVCHDHAQMMCIRSDQSETLPSGHARMLSCPPIDHIRNSPDVIYPHQAPPGVPAAILMRLFAISAALPIAGGEITPIQALQMILQHERYREITPADYEWLTNELKDKSRCYGFGAVLEEFEVRDALQLLFEKKQQAFAGFKFD